MNLTFTAQPQPSSTVLMWEACSEAFYEERPVSWLRTPAENKLRVVLRADAKQGHAGKIAESVGISPA